jgi:hypothetical protein
MGVAQRQNLDVPHASDRGAAAGALAKLWQRALTLPRKRHEAEEARIEELEQLLDRKVGETAQDIKDHVDKVLEPLLARAEGRIPPRPDGQSASSRKAEVDQSMLSLRIKANAPKLRKVLTTPPL